MIMFSSGKFSGNQGAIFNSQLVWTHASSELPTPETHGETGSVHPIPKRSQKAVLQHVKQKNLHFSIAFWDRLGWTDPVSL